MLIFAVQAPTGESVRAELVQLQNDKGLTLAWPDGKGGVKAVLFDERRVVSLKDSLQEFGPGGYGNPPSKPSDSWVDARSHFTSQCWSPDHNQVAYESEGSVKVCQIGGDASSVRVLAEGTDVTWSPDGNWIAFRYGDTYYAIRPDGNDRRKLFHSGGAVSALYWSPNSRIVAYVRILGLFQGYIDANQLRVRRLEDGSDDRVCPNGTDLGLLKWITSRELMKRTGSESLH
jgi:hypothetical protein